jgi:hypothetical protein
MIPIVALVFSTALVARPETARASFTQIKHRIDAEDVIEAGLVARGGRARLAKLQRMHSRGGIQDLTNGGSANWDSTASMPGEMVYRMEPYVVGGFFERRVHGSEVTEHDHDWHELTGLEREESLIEAVFDGDLRWKELYPHVQLLGQVDFEGTPAWSVEMTSRAGRTHIAYYAVETYFLIGEDRIVDMDELHRPDTDHVARKFTMRTTMSDFRKVNGLVFSFKSVRHKAADYLDEFVITTDSIELGFK